MFAPSSDVRRFVFFFPSRAETLYGSIYAAPDPVRFGVVVAPSIGLEAAQSLDPAHALAAAAADIGGAGMVFHPPGSLDSSGDPAGLTLDAFADAVSDAATELRARVPAEALCLIGFRFGAAAAVLAAVELDPDAVALLAPTRHPAAAVEEVRREAARATLGRSAATEAFGHTLPLSFADAGDHQRIEATMESMAERLVVARFAEPPPEPLPEGTENLVVPDAMSGCRRRWANHLARAVAPAVRRRMDVPA